MAKQVIKFAPFEDSCSSIILDGVEVGHIEKDVTVDWDRYDTSTSRCTKSFERVAGYMITLWDDRVGEDLGNEADTLGTIKSLKGARDVVRELLKRAKVPA